MYDETEDAVGRMVATIKRKHGRVETSLVQAIEPIDIGDVRSKLARPNLEQDDPPLDGYGLYKALISRIPHNIQASFTPEQTRAIRQASEQLRWGKHPLDFRLSLPIPGRRLYFVFLAGLERRSKKRIEEEGSDLTVGKIAWLFFWGAMIWIIVFAASGGVTF